MIKLKQLLKETFIGDKWYPAHTQESLKWVLSQENVPIYPKTIEKLIGQFCYTCQRLWAGFRTIFVLVRSEH